VLTFTTLFPNAVVPGHGIFVQTRMRMLCARHPVDVQVVAPVPWFPSSWRGFGRYAAYAKIARRERLDGFTVHHPRYPVVPKVGMHLAPQLLEAWTFPAVRALLREGFDFDVIDAHYFYPDGVAAAAIARRLGKPLIVTARGSDINLIARFPRPRRMMARAARQADAVVTVSEDLRRRVLELGVDAGKVSTLRNGVDLDLFTPPAERAAVRAELGFTRPTLLCVGNLVELKGHHLVIDALATLPDFDLVVVGEGPRRALLEALVRERRLENRVSLPGAVAQRELVRYYGAADALVLASSREGWANVLLEAMACGTPAVATALAGTPEVIGSPEAGVLIAERSAGAIAAGCRELFAAAPDRAATRRYSERFSWDETSDALESLLRRAVGTRNDTAGQSAHAIGA
jgi:glycosyltransferase involved in cell wall biosynthesis